MLYFIYRNTHYLIGGVRMKKLISVFLCAVLIVSVFSANAFAASPDTFHTDSLSCHTTEVAPCIEGSHFCSSCGMQGTSVASWPEYTSIILTGGKPFVATMLLAAITERLGQSLSWLLKTLVTKSNPILRLVTILNEALFIFPVED